MSEQPMSKEQIEEMARVIGDCAEMRPFNICDECRAATGKYCSHIKLATKLYNAGYRKQSEIEKLENKLFFDALESVFFSLVYLGADGKWHTKRNNAEKTTTIIERYKELVVKMKGGDADA